MDIDYFDDLETRAPRLREAAQFAELPFQIANARERAPYYQELLHNVAPVDVNSRVALASLPVTRKSDLLELQKKLPPFGGLTTVSPGKLVRIFQSPGPIYDVQGHGRDYWRITRALYAAGIRGGDVIHNSFSYHLTPAAAMVESGAAALGCAVVPAGTGNTDLQIRAINHIRPHAYAGTPTFLKLLVEKARESGTDISSLKKATVAAEALPASLRADLANQGIDVRQWYGTADVGLIAYESSAMDGLIVDEGIIVEIVRPGTTDPVPDGTIGEVVVTTLYSREYPLVRFATGDLSAVLTGPSPCGRTNMRLRGWLGRADQTTKVRGLFVYPSQITDAIRRHPEVLRARLVITRDKQGLDVMTLHCETSGANASEIAEALQSTTKIRGAVELMAPGSLPTDGKLIEDRRTLA